MDEYDVDKARQAQAILCKEKGYPDFAPSSGSCWKCHRNIYEQVEREQKDWLAGKMTKYTTGITVDKASTKLITGCPHCNRSYCD